MKIDSNYKFKVSLSKDAYENKEISGAMIGTTRDINNREIRKKYGFKGNMGVGYMECETTPTELLEALTTGHVFCHLFNPTQIRKDGTFSSSQKNNDNFRGSYVVGVDIDKTNYNTAEEFISKLSLKPTLFYTSYSNLQPNKGARFRLIYVFDDIIAYNYLEFRFVAYYLNRIIEIDTNETIDDDCNLRCSQYFNGTNKNNSELFVSFGLTGNIYNLSDLNLTETKYIDFLKNNCYYKTKTHKEDINKQLSQYTINNLSTTYYIEMETNTTQENNENSGINEEKLLSDVLVSDMCRLEYDEFMKYNRHKYKYFYRVEKDEWINGLYQFVDDNYFSLYYNVFKVKDGSERRKKLYQRMCLRRVINPNVDANTILFNAYEDLHRFFENNSCNVENVITVDELVKNVEWAFSKSIEEIEDDFSDNLQYLRESTRPKRGIIYNGKKSHTKETTYLILDDCYNNELSVNENLEIINNTLGYKVAKSTVYNYLKDRNLTTSSNKLTDNEIMELIDTNLSKRENLRVLKDNGIKIGNKRLNSLFDLKINNSVSTTYYTKMENDTTTTLTENKPNNNTENSNEFSGIMTPNYFFDDNYVSSIVEFHNVEDYRKKCGFSIKTPIYIWENGRTREII